MKICCSISNPRNRWVLNREPILSPAFAIAELFWILDGRNDSKFINTWNPALSKYAGDRDYYDGAYGQRLQSYFKIDQIEQAYETLKHNPSSRQVVLQIWDAKKDLPNKEGTANNKDIPCNIMSLLKIRDNKLEWSQIMRSNDLIMGLPYNFIQFTTLQEIIAGWLNVDIGEYYYFADSLHMYDENRKKYTKKSRNLSVDNLDKLLFTKEKYNIFFPVCMDILNTAYKQGVKEEDLIKLTSCKIIPQEYKNLLIIPLSYIAYKKKNFKLVKNFEELSTNKLLLSIWYLWKESN